MTNLVLNQEFVLHCMYFVFCELSVNENDRNMAFYTVVAEW